MNAVEIEEAVSKLAEQPFDPQEFPFAFLEAFGNPGTTIRKLKSGASNKSDVSGGVLQRNHIHLKICPDGEVTATLAALRESPATTKWKAKFILATDGKTFEAENLIDGETVACAYPDFPNHFGFFLPLAGITTVRQIRESAFDIRATSRLNKLYIELLRENPDWDTEARRQEMNHFMARLIFCFFAEDTDIFHGKGLFTATIDQMSARDSSNTHEVLSELFRAMNTGLADREGGNFRNWANVFPYVNGGLFSDSVDVPRFSRIARSYLLHVGGLDWTKINPDIFGSMIQAVADDEERGNIGMHYTSVPNILKVLNPLFLDDLRARLEEAGDNARKLLNLRQRIARIRVFDPACGSGNFLVIAYKQMREVEADINRRRGEAERRSDIPLTNFRGIEIRHFSCEIARLALIIAEYQCDVIYRGQQLALAEFLPLEAANWIEHGNALQLDWLTVCPPEGKKMKTRGDDLFGTPLDQTVIDFDNEGGETYICGNPPYRGSSWQTKDQKSDLERLAESTSMKAWRSLDYVAGWFIKGARYLEDVEGSLAFVATKTICEGEQVPVLWQYVFGLFFEIIFAHEPFNWSNLASNKAGVTVIIVGVGRGCAIKKLYDGSGYREVGAIGPYLAPNSTAIVQKRMFPISLEAEMLRGNMPTDGGHLLMSAAEASARISQEVRARRFLRPYMGASELVNASPRYCIWIEASSFNDALETPFIRERVALVRQSRLDSSAPTTRATKVPPYRFMQVEGTARNHTIALPAISSGNREYLPAALLPREVILSNKCYVLYDAPLWNLAVANSKLHLTWISTVCARMRTDYSYSNTLGWNTFPVPTLTEQNKADLTRCAEDILLAREAHFPATIADLYDPETMPPNLREAHERNDETLERIYIGRRFKNDTERLEKLFELYTQMITRHASPKKAARNRPEPAQRVADLSGS